MRTVANATKQLYGLILKIFVCVAVVRITWPTSRQGTGVLHALQHTCPGATVKLSNNGSLDWFTEDITGLLATVDHTFILSRMDCIQSIPAQLAGRVTCVRGSIVDTCVPPAYTKARTASLRHALRVTFSHVYILYIAQQAHYANIAVIEADAVFMNRSLSRRTIVSVRRLVESREWNMIRVGFRPYFLEKSAVQHCPTRCRCILQSKFGENMCLLQGSSCDIRSSDFYMIPSREYAPLYRRILDSRRSILSRIIDMRPIQVTKRHWLLIPQLSFQSRLDIPLDYQIGQAALYVKKCVGPRPLSDALTRQLQPTTM